jgi:hypothetical protein
MGVPIRIDEEIYEEAKRVAKAECRSVPQQIEYWARIGKCALNNLNPWARPRQTDGIAQQNQPIRLEKTSDLAGMNEPIGKCALDNPDLPIEFIRDVLMSKLADRSLAEPFEFEGEDE